MAHKLNEALPAALHACQQALYLYERQRNRGEISEISGELGHLHLALSQLEKPPWPTRRMSNYALNWEMASGESLLATIGERVDPAQTARRGPQGVYRASRVQPAKQLDRVTGRSGAA
ncbi:MAG: hypothetical protein IPI57_07280 [Candidatus Competibacteraceae bacterium]|nr:hypothetical protein [Candidatus Competibacteraceae bacterium]